ncbi:hypothetical protein HWV62_4471 [Athelia sp. TMB]|nr:hypothetical protein HWV62_4471 [Athelia sp. TMB]
MYTSVRAISSRQLKHASVWSLAATSRYSSLRDYSTVDSNSRSHPKPESPESAGWALKAFLLGLAIPSFGWAVNNYLAKSSNNRSSSELQHTQYGSAQDFKQAVAELQSTFATHDGVVSLDPAVLHQHGFSVNDYHDGLSHSVVVYPQSTQDVVKIVNISRKFRMPIVPYSGATSLEGHFIGATGGGICLDMSEMDAILELHGIPLFFPLDPSPGATLGGMLSTGCSGMVLPSGEVIKTRRRARKSSAGFDTTKLFIGAEGTLGIVTEVTIRLAPLLPTNVAVAQFPDVETATRASIDVMNRGVGIRASIVSSLTWMISSPAHSLTECVELCDDNFMRATNKYGQSQRKWPEKDSLFFKFQGPSQLALDETARIVKEVVEKHGGTGFSLAANAKEAADLWADRKNAHYSGLALVEGSKGWATDVCVPVSNLPRLVQETKRDLAELGIVSTIVGHIGDGNFHCLLLFKNEEEQAIVRDAVHKMVERAISLDGTCTGEHGVGIGKREYLYEELGEGTVELMKTIKRTLDPLNLFNPGKLYPDALVTKEPARS